MAPTYVTGTAEFTQPARRGGRGLESASSLSASAVPSGKRHAVNELGKAACGAGTFIPFFHHTWGAGLLRPDLCQYCLAAAPWVAPD